MIEAILAAIGIAGLLWAARIQFNTWLRTRRTLIVGLAPGARGCDLRLLKQNERGEVLWKKSSFLSTDGHLIKLDGKYVDTVREGRYKGFPFTLIDAVKGQQIAYTGADWTNAVDTKFYKTSVDVNVGTSVVGALRPDVEKMRPLLWAGLLIGGIALILFVTRIVGSNA